MKKESKRARKSRMKGLLFFLPNLVKLVYRLLRDARVSSADKAILAGTILYTIAPLDFMPDFIPFIGQVDDAYLIAISLLRMMNRAGEDIVNEHWDGNRDIYGVITSIADLAQFFLPKKIRHVLVGKFEHPQARFRVLSGGGR